VLRTSLPNRANLLGRASLWFSSSADLFLAA
jgi:hypothetical protein